AHQPMAERYAGEYDISEHVPILLRIIAGESGGTADDVVQSSESLGLSPNSLGTAESTGQGTKYIADLLHAAEAQEVDTKTAQQKKDIARTPYKAITLVAVLLITWRRMEKHIALHWQNPLRKNVQVEIKSPIAIPLP